ncbi:hypothetical protein GMI69_09925 [Eggerthellaceae bacterium zg-887]|uniref:hypothetical protein n=1 Tax=Xiamenia xianingshaonis TaxID=2682776 RepID=UPI00140E2BB0|nr:hypothetical protein [Xiamenia xianingshaonis]NHM16952.1 hypothetical protein [Xiamenia xianingshaonis]
MSEFGVVFRTNGVTLDLGNNTITGQGHCAIYVGRGVQNVTIKNGFLDGGTFCTVWMSAEEMSLTLKNVTVTSTDDHGGIYDYGIGSTLNLENCDVLGDRFAIHHNGMTGGFKLTATDSRITAMEGGVDACAVYVSGDVDTDKSQGRNKINLTGCTVTGPGGIEGKFTDMTLTDCDITGYATPPTFEQYNNGSTSSGFAVVATDNTLEEAPAPQGTIKIDGGTYTGLVGLSQYKAAREKYPSFVDAKYEITGGAFSLDPYEYKYAKYEYKKGSDNLYRCAHSGTDKTVLGSYPATCGRNGYAGTTYCDFCEQAVATGRTIPATGEHAYGEWQTTKVATETDPGTQERSCSVCNAKETQEVPALGHAPSAAWQSDAADHWKVCERCGAELEKAAHSFGDWQVTKEAAETEPGSRERSCSVCGATEVEELPALGHAPSAAWSSNADAHWKACERCNAELERAPHAFGEWRTTKEATAEAAGLRERSCAACGHAQTEETPRLSPVPEGGSGWVESDDGEWGYVEAGEPVEQGWKEVGGEWYYFDDSAMQTGWKEVDGDWYYLNGAGEGTEGSMATGWKQDGDSWYYLEGSGKMATGWAEVGGEWYHLGKSGKMDTGWKQDGGAWYYLNGAGEGTEGAMATGWKKTGGKWYYLNKSGAMRSGWQRLGGAWYLLNASHDGTFGAMLEGWQRVDASAGKPTSANSWYYLNPGSGAMAANSWVGGYYVDGSGLWVR